MNRQGKVGEQVVRQPPTNENCLIKKGMLRVHHSYKLSFVRQRGLWDILMVRRSLCKKRHPEQLAVCVNAHECVMRGHRSSILFVSSVKMYKFGITNEKIWNT